MRYLVSFSEADLELIQDALDFAARNSLAETSRLEFERMWAELNDLKARQDSR
jgi:hypothetical protein